MLAYCSLKCYITYTCVLLCGASPLTYCQALARFQNASDARAAAMAFIIKHVMKKWLRMKIYEELRKSLAYSTRQQDEQLATLFHWSLQGHLPFSKWTKVQTLHGFDMRSASEKQAANNQASTFHTEIYSVFWFCAIFRLLCWDLHLNLR